MLDILSHPDRRRILLLIKKQKSYGKDEFAIKEFDAIDNKQLTPELYHNHLPKLANVGYIEWNKDANMIRIGPNFEEITPLLRFIHDYQKESPEKWP
ncbi:hypothetical protein GCM10009000_062820 [Halobacterium noricense]|uniref:DUF7344 domain-containing protein n=1 Tax=Haladaptatus pallidirubidus TaxID=1008152 RepID=A0AAV3UJI3_9EURY